MDGINLYWQYILMENASLCKKRFHELSGTWLL
jgi:hypothetical protein